MLEVPSSTVGNLMYAMICTRSDIAQAMGAINRYMSSPGKEHCRAVKWILRYLKGSSDMTLCCAGTDIQLMDMLTLTLRVMYTVGGVPLVMSSLWEVEL